MTSPATTFTSGTVVTSDWANAINRDSFEYKVNVKDFGGIGDGVTDNYAAITAAINHLTTITAAPNYSAKGVLEFGPGTWFCSDTIGLEHQLTIRGTGSPSGNGYGVCILKFPTGKIGIHIRSAQTATSGKDAAGTCIENITITTTRGSAAKEAGKHGVYSNTRFKMRNVIVSLFGDTGCNIIAEAGVTGNANCWYLENCRFAENGYDGLYVEGLDTNAGTAISVDCGNNLRWGFFDASFLGNTYIGCHTNNNTSGGYKTSNLNGYSTFVGCYTEGGETNAIIAPSLIIGGILSNSPNTGSAPSIGAGLGNELHFRNTDIRPELGISFSETTTSSSASTLDRYLEGTWTPTVANVTLAAGAPSAATATGRYTVIGNVVNWWIEYIPSNTTTIAFTAGSTTFTLPLTPYVPSQGFAGPLDGSSASAVGIVKTDGKFYPRNLTAVNNTIILSGSYSIAT